MEDVRVVPAYADDLAAICFDGGHAGLPALMYSLANDNTCRRYKFNNGAFDSQLVRIHGNPISGNRG